MESCILAKSPSLSTALRRVLYGFHGQKSQAKVDAMLLRLYEPILFRNLAAANNAVRCNAYLLLFDTFPIQVAAADSCAFAILNNHNWPSHKNSELSLTITSFSTRLCEYYRLSLEDVLARVIAMGLTSSALEICSCSKFSTY